jgi:hypothetical protein
MADKDYQNEDKFSEKIDFYSVIKNNPLPALSLSFTITLASIGLLYTIFNSWNNSLAGVIILIIILLILPMALTIGTLLIISNTRAFERFKQKIAPVAVIYIILLLVCVSLAYVCVPKSESSSANPSMSPTTMTTLYPTQNPTAAPSDNSVNSGKATINLKNGGTIKNATVKFGPRGWDTYVSSSFEYTNDLTVIAHATYGPQSGRFLQLAKVKSINFIDMNDEEKKVVNENSVYRDHVRKVTVTYGDGKIVSNIYLIEYAYYDTEAEHGSIQDTPVTSIVY